MSHRPHIAQFALIRRAVELLTERYPTMALDHAEDALMAIIVQSSATPVEERRIEEVALEVLNSEAVSVNLPPWI
jgi:hypothetical protein